MFTLLLGAVVLLAATEGEAAGLLAYVPCYDFNKVKFRDPIYDRSQWAPGRNNLSQRGRSDVKIIDQFVKAKGIVYQHVAMVCELTLTHIHIGMYWINDAGSTLYPGEAGILNQSPTHFQFYLRTTRRNHAVEFRVQFYGQYFIQNHSKATASFTCIVVNRLFNGDGDRPDTGCDFINWPSE
uniref:Uncharacterized protein n=1 Tax=Graphocephala atropunctata TaxID=36148 RepID=A0A1B6LBC1_9HEMI